MLSAVVGDSASCDREIVLQYLSLSEIKSEHSDGVIRRELVSGGYCP